MDNREEPPVYELPPNAPDLLHSEATVNGRVAL